MSSAAEQEAGPGERAAADGRGLAKGRAAADGLPAGVVKDRKSVV